MTKRKIALAIVGVICLALAGLLIYQNNKTPSFQENEVIVYTNSKNITEHQIQLSDGMWVRCLKYSNVFQGGLSCDFAHPSPWRWG